MLYNEKEKLWNKENKLFSWQRRRKVNSLLGGVETISPSSFPSRKRKNRGIPLWQHQQEITSFLLPDWTRRSSPLLGHWDKVGGCAAMSHSAAASKSSLYFNRPQTQTSLYLSSLKPLNSSLVMPPGPQNWENRWTLSQHLTVSFFLPRNYHQMLFFLQKNILTATQTDIVELKPSIHLTTLTLDWNRTNGLNIISALQPIFSSSFSQPRCNRLFNRVFQIAVLP